VEEANGLLDFIGPLLTELSDYSVRQEMLEEQLEEIMEEVKDDYRAALRPGWEELQIELENNINIVNNLTIELGKMGVEIDDPTLRSNFLNQVGGIEEKVYIQISDEKIKALPEKDVDRTSSEGKASSVQFIHFNFTKEQIKNFKNFKNDVFLIIEDSLYNHKTKIPSNIREALIKDFI